MKTLFPEQLSERLSELVGRPNSRSVFLQIGVVPARQTLGVSQRPLTLILPQKYRDTNGRRIVIHIGGVYTTFCHREGIHLIKCAIEMGGVSRYFFTCIGVRGRVDSPEDSDPCAPSTLALNSLAVQFPMFKLMTDQNSKRNALHSAPKTLLN